MKKIYLMLIFCLSFIFSGTMFAGNAQAEDNTVKVIKVGGDDGTMDDDKVDDKDDDMDDDKDDKDDMDDKDETDDSENKDDKSTM